MQIFGLLGEAAAMVLASAVVFISDSCLFYSRRGKLAGWRTCVQGIIQRRN